MTPSDERPGFMVTQAKIALLLSLFTVMTLIYQGSKYFIDTQYRLASLEEKWVGMAGTQRDVAFELRNLNASINELNLVLREVQVRQAEVQK